MHQKPTDTQHHQQEMEAVHLADPAMTSGDADGLPRSHGNNPSSSAWLLCSLQTPCCAGDGDIYIIGVMWSFTNRVTTDCLHLDMDHSAAA